MTGEHNNDYVWDENVGHWVPAKVIDTPRGRTERARELDSRVVELKNIVYDTYFELGQVLRDIKAGMYYKELGFDSLATYAEVKHGFRERKAHYLIAIVENCEAAGLTKEDVRGIEWSKMKELPQLTKENRAEWLQRAKSLSVEELRAKVKESKGEPLEAKRFYMGFSFEASQKEIVERALEVAAKLTGSEVRSYHLQVIAEEFLATYEALDQVAVRRFQNMWGGRDNGKKD